MINSPGPRTIGRPTFTDGVRRYRCAGASSQIAPPITHVVENGRALPASACSPTRNLGLSGSSRRVAAGAIRPGGYRLTDFCRRGRRRFGSNGRVPLLEGRIGADAVAARARPGPFYEGGRPAAGGRSEFWRRSH
ncbi:hypothetical protein EVAR_48530_1 [Eumeta japonica]|uniref:Uncharacterized protein n=1 Tax=Eumeta variegata TaxID=151549 RepID=A0A4C1YC10_EUMVA|nr:hypothetical protein EVAR_48530_1 [Eumeta japonica]